MTVHRERAETAASYNGWTNWETWNTHLWMTNDQELYSVARGIVERGTTLGLSATAEVLRDWWNDRWCVYRASPLSDAWRVVIDRTDWVEIIEALRD